MGYEPVIAPLLDIVVRPIATLSGVQATLATSRNAIPALRPAGRLLAVGDATAACARAHGFAEVESADGDAARLAELVTRRCDARAGPLLLAAGAGQGHALAATLRARGFRVVRRVGYRARPARRLPPAALQAIGGGQLHAALFLSAETAMCFVRLLPPECSAMLTTVSALAIGTSTAGALDALPWLRICRAATPTLDGVLALL